MPASAGAALLDQPPFRSTPKKTLDLKAGVLLYRAGDSAECFYLLASGFMKLYDRHSGEEILSRVAAPGMIIGEEGAFHGTRRQTARAANECQVVELRPSDFGDRAAEGWRWLADRLERQAADFQALHSWVRNHKVENRILLVLASLASGAGGKLPLSQSEIGALVGATRETSSTLLNRLQRRGLLQLGRGAVIVPSVEQLRQALTK
jgi:CRP/FNR family transcriptional regulator